MEYTCYCYNQSDVNLVYKPLKDELESLKRTSGENSFVDDLIDKFWKI